MNIQELIQNITHLHAHAIPKWYQSRLDLKEQGLLKLIEENHFYNYKLWRAEDCARRDDLGHSFVYQAKRDIDHFNQQRNNRMEGIDEALTAAIACSIDPNCPIHSETPGMIMDRLSILSLKSYHMEIESLRETADAQHRLTCTHKLATLRAQHAQLTLCLQNFLQELVAKTRTFRRYHQFKMYNDPALNPELYLQNQK